MPRVLDIQGVGEVEIPDEATPQQIQQFLDENYNKPKVSGLGAAGRGFGTSILPTGAGMAAAAPIMPFATAAAPVTYGLSYLVPLAVGAGAAWLTEKAQRPVLKAAFPELEQLQAADIEQHPYWAMGGRLAAVAPFAEFSPGQGIRGLASIPAALKGSPEARRMAAGVGLNIGLQEALTTGQSLAQTGKLPSKQEVAEAAIAGTAFGQMRGPLGRLAGHEGKVVKRPEASPEVRAAREKMLLEQSRESGRPWVIVDSIPDNPKAVAETNPETGEVTVSRRNLHNYIEQDLRKDVTPEQAIADLISHETKHGGTPDALAQEFVDTLSPKQKYLYRRRYGGPGYATREISDLNLGREAIRYELQRASEMGPSEYISHTAQEKNVVKFLDILDRATALARKMLGKDATPAQTAILDKVKANLEAARTGVPDARSQQEATTVHGDVRPQPVEGIRKMSVQERRARIQQEAARLEELRKEKVLLGPNEPMQGEELLEAAVVGPGNKIFYAPHHPAAWEKAGGKELKDKFPKREDREGPGIAGAENGYRTNRRPYVPRDLGTKIANKSGQDIRKFDEPIHTDEAKLPEWVRDAMIRAGLDPGRTLNDVDLSNPSVRAAIQNDPTLTPEQKQQVLRTGSVKAPAAPTLESELKKHQAALHTPDEGAKMGRTATPQERREYLRSLGLPEEGIPSVYYFDEKLHGAQPGSQNWNDTLRELAQFTVRKAPPAAPTVGAPQGQAPKGLATVPPAGLAAGGPAAGTTISRTPATVKEGRLAELQKLLREPGRVPSKEEWEEYSELTKESRARAIAEARARRTGAAAMIRKGPGGKEERIVLTVAEAQDFEYWRKQGHTPEDALEMALINSGRITTPVKPQMLKGTFGEKEPPAMIQKGPGLMSDEEVAARVDSLFQVKGAGAVFSQPEREARSQKMVDVLMSLPPEKRVAALTRFQTHVNRAIDEQAAKDRAAQTTPQEQEADAQVDAQIQANIGKARSLGFNVLPVMPVATREFLNSGMIAHLNKKPVPKPAEQRVDPKTGKPIPTKEQVRMEWTFGDYPSYLRALRAMERRRAEQTGEEIHMPEEYIRQAWHENLNDFLNNASADQLKDLLRVHGRANVEAEETKSKMGRVTNIIAEVDASGILQRLDRKYPEPGTEEFEKYKAYNNLNDQEAIDQIQMDKAAALAALERYAKVRRVSPQEAEQQLRKQVHAELTEAQKGATRKGFQAADERRIKAIGFLSEKMDEPARPPALDPLRNKLTPEDIETYTTLTPEQASNVSLLRSELWRGTTVKGKTASKFTKGVLILVHPVKGWHDAVSFYLHPTTKDIMVNDPRFLPGDRTQPHVGINGILAEWRIEALVRLNSPVTQFHQRWKTQAGFLAEIGEFAKAKETLQGLEWTKWQREAKRSAEEAQRAREEAEVQKPVTEEELAGEEKLEPGEEPKKTEEEAKPQEEQIEEEGLRPAEAGLIQEAAGFESQVTGEKRLMGPGHNELAIDKTDPRNLSRGPLTSAEAESIARVFAEHEQSKRHPIKKPTDMLEMLKRMQFRRRHVSWFGKKPMGLRGQDYAFATGLDKMTRFWYLELVKDNQHILEGFDRIPRDVPYEKMNNSQRAHWDFREELKQEALMTALDHIYELAQTAKKKGVSNYEADFRSRALEIYGEHSRRNIERAAVSQERGVELTTTGRARPIPVEGGVTAGRRFPREPVPPEPLSPEAQRFVQERAQAMKQKPDPLAFEKPPFAPKPKTLEQAYLRPFIRTKAGREMLSRYQPQLTKGTTRGIKQVEVAPDWAAMIRKGGGEEAPSLGGVGVANRVREQMAARGVAEVIQGKIPTMSPAELIELGRVKWKSWEDTIARMRYSEESGLTDWSEDPFIARYGQFQLDQKVDQIAKAEGGLGSQKAQKAMADANAFAQMFKDLYATHAGNVMRGFQGEVDPVTSRMTFVRQLETVRKRKLTHEEMGEIDDIWDSMDEATGEHQTSIKKADAAATKLLNKPLEKGQAKMVASYREQVQKSAAAAEAFIQDFIKGHGAMAAKGETPKPEPLPDMLMDALSNVGLDVMTELSDAGRLTDAAWTEAMQKRYGHRFDDHLEKIRAVVEEIRDRSIRNYMGTGQVTAEARERLTRKKPTVEQSKAAIQKALEADPTGRHITNVEAYHIWNYLKQTYFDKGVLDFKKIRTEASADLGIKDSTTKEITNPYTQMRLFRAMTTNRSMREPTKEMIVKSRNEALMKGQAANWLKNQEFPKWLRVLRMFPRVFFFDKIMGHGLVPMITHAPDMLFNPRSWSVYFGHYKTTPSGKVWVPGAWQEMYRMTFGTDVMHRLGGGQEFTSGADYHDFAMLDMIAHERFEDWKSAGLQANPFKYTDDYQIEGLQKIFGEKLVWLTAGRGFDALKTLRYAMAEKWLNSLPEHLRNRESMELIADSVNHATGIVKTRFHESLNWAFFAPKLEASRWAYLFKDTIKAANYVKNWQTATLEQRAWAKSELQQKAMVVAWYYGMLALNQAFLAMSGSDQKINGLPKALGGGGVDPRKADFMSFKVAGFKVGVANPFIGIVRLFSNTLHTAFGERTKFERLTQRQDALKEVAGTYARGKFSPLASFTTDILSAQDYAKRPIGFLPWSEPLSMRKRLQGARPYEFAEYTLGTFAPIPLEEAIKNTWKSMGMSESEASHLLRSLIIAGGMGLTGARIQELEK